MDRVLHIDRFEKWANGNTGWPFFDACMRQLNTTGWINFRMRAMMMSCASYNLWLPWRETGEHLARLFLDYEPGIHWSQVGMQSGTTGINTIRAYSMTKQGKDHDPNGEYIGSGYQNYRWCLLIISMNHGKCQKRYKNR